MFAGTYTALVTPFENDALDVPALARLIEQQISAGVEGVVAVGTTGESPTLSHEEHLRVVGEVVRLVRGRCRVIAGTGSNSTREAVVLTSAAAALGADGTLHVAPYYNKPSQEGLYRHFRAVAEATALPVILYSIPGRCGVEIGVETTVRLAGDCPTIVAIKEAGGSVERVSQLRAALPDTFSILSGDDSLTLPFLAVGAVGVVSVASNLIPAEIAAMVRAWSAGEVGLARQIHGKYYPLFKDLFIEPNPVPIKTALAREGLMRAEVRLPLCEMAPATLAQLERTLTAVGRSSALTV